MLASLPCFPACCHATIRTHSYNFNVFTFVVVLIPIATGPLTAPHSVNINWLNSTTMNVSWVPLNLVEARGFVQFYVITYEPTSGGSRRKRQQQTVQVNGSASSGIVGGLQPGVPYDVSVSGQTVEPGLSEFK